MFFLTKNWALDSEPGKKKLFFFEKKYPKNESKNHVLSPGTPLDRSGMVDLPEKKLIRI